MAFFKFRKGVDEPAPPPPMAESVEDLRKRARHRLIGASVLVLLGVVGFPMLFDSQPRPIAVDIPIEIPDKNAQKPSTAASTAASATPMIVETEAESKPVAPLPAPAPRPAAATVPAAAPVVAPVAAPVAAPVPRPTVVAVAPPPKTTPPPVPTPKTQTSPEPKPHAMPVEKPIDKPVDKPVKKEPVPVDNGAKARALLDGKAADAPAANAENGRFVIQVGAFSDANKAQDVRNKLERAGLKTYTQVVQTKDGARTRVRVGPVATRVDADKLVERIHKLDLPASVLSL